MGTTVAITIWTALATAATATAAITIWPTAGTSFAITTTATTPSTTVLTTYERGRANGYECTMGTG